MADESDEEFTDRVIAEARARHGAAGDGTSLDGTVGEWVWAQLRDPEVLAALTPAELEQVLVILRGVWARKVQGDMPEPG